MKKGMPKLYDFLLRIILPEEDSGNLRGDYQEIFFSLFQSSGKLQAHVWILKQIIKSLPIYIVDSLGGSMAMFKRNIILAIRVLRKQKVYSLINIFGLSLGITAFVFFAYMGGIHLHADNFHRNSENLFGIVQVNKTDNSDSYHTTNISSQLLDVLINEIPEINKGTLFRRERKIKIKIGREVFEEKRVLFADNNFFSVFSFDLTKGDYSSCLEDPGSVVLSKRYSEKYFGKENPVGKTIIINDSLQAKVTAVSENIERNSSIRYDLILDIETAKIIDKEYYNWKNNKYTTFVEIGNKDQKEIVDRKLKSIINRYWKESERPENIYLFPLSDFRLYAGGIDTDLKVTDFKIVASIFIFGSLLLIVACFNFINLSIARYMYRVKEVGMRKVFGARRNQLIKQFLTESLIVSLFAMLIGVIIYEAAQPFFATYITGLFEVGGLPEFSLSIVENNYLLIYVFGAGILAGVISGIFPALYITSLNPVNSIKSGQLFGSKRRRGTRFLIIVQFAFSILIIVLSSQLKTQFQHWTYEADFGYNRDNVIAIEYSSPLSDKKSIALEKIKENSDALSVSASSGLPGLWAPGAHIRLREQTEENARSVYSYGVYYDFEKVFQIDLAEGRSFSRKFKDEKSIIINEKLKEDLGLEKPLGEVVMVNGEEAIIIGIAENFVFSDIVLNIPPCLLYLEKNNLRYLVTRVNEKANIGIMNSMFKDNWKEVFPNEPFNSFTLVEYFENTMKFADLLVGMLSAMGYLAAIFSYIGLIGLVSFMIERKTKEISVRKILGASVNTILKRTYREYLGLIIISNIIALPLAYYLWNKFIQIGVMSTLNMDTSILLAAVLITLMLAGAGIYARIHKVVHLNPANTLRNE